MKTYSPTNKKITAQQIKEWQQFRERYIQATKKKPLHEYVVEYAGKENSRGWTIPKRVIHG